MTKRILIWFWSSGGGGGQFAVNLARRLAMRFGPDAIDLSLRADDPTLERARRLGVRVLAADIVSDRKRPIATIASLAASASVLAEHARDADIVILPMNFAAAAPLSLTLAKPLVYCAHDPEPHPGDYEAMAQRATQAVLLRRATKVIALSEFAAESLKRLYPGVRAKLRAAPLSSVFSPLAPTPPRAGPTRLLFAGRMIAYKGLDILADALERIAGRDDWRLTIAGAGPALTQAARRRLAHRQIDSIRGDWLQEAELESLIAECDVVLAPYRSATQSGLVAQALAHGKPCVVTPVGALAEQIGGGRAGWVAAGANGEAFAAALALALDGRALVAEKSVAAAALARAAWEGTHWDWLRTS